MMRSSQKDDDDDDDDTGADPLLSTESTSTSAWASALEPVSPTPTPCHYYEVTGVVAHSRLSPLLPSDWIDVTKGRETTKSSGTSSSGGRKEKEDNNDNANDLPCPDFLWENTARQQTKNIRDHVKVYSHLPNGQSILDSKWVLGRLFAFDQQYQEQQQQNNGINSNGSHENPKGLVVGTCETHCFCGLDGFEKFANRVGLLQQNPPQRPQEQTNDPSALDHNNGTHDSTTTHQWPDILDTNRSCYSSSTSTSSSSQSSTPLPPPPPPPNMWVIKDAAANGAGGIWVVGSQNASQFCDQSDKTTSPLYPHHKYVAQKYVWPPLLYGGKKFHVRVYVTISCDGHAYVHKRAFLHVANDVFHTTGFGGGHNMNGDSDNGTGSSSSTTTTRTMFDDCVHITNCCANSHDDTKFAGEILADFEETEFTTWQEHQEQPQQHVDSGGNGDPPQPPQKVVPLADFFPSVQATVAEVTKRAFPFLDGGQKNQGFEYCGMDFMLSYKDVGKNKDDNNNEKTTQRIPVAYLLEINAPPSQDTATGLPHAETLHDEVLRDWMNFWVVPRVVDGKVPDDERSGSVAAANVPPMGGWRCVYAPPPPLSVVASDKKEANSDTTDFILPSKAAILNKIRWALYERKLSKRIMENEKETTKNSTDTTESGSDQSAKGTRQSHKNALVAKEVSDFARLQFPFFLSSSTSTPKPQRDESIVFFESAGGAQVPKCVMDAMHDSLCYRNRSVIGNKTKVAARTISKVLFGAAESTVVLGPNATALLSSLAQTYLWCNLITPNDEIVVSTENHRANFDPWVEVAARAGATLKLWTPFSKTKKNDKCEPSQKTSNHLANLITPRTRLVAIPHASNVLGTLNPIVEWAQTVKSRSGGRAHIVVDGVAAAPHVFVAFDELAVDWYVISMHKLFGPHLGVLLARKNKAMDQLVVASGVSCGNTESALASLLESGTANLEGCAGVTGLAVYFQQLATLGRVRLETTIDQAPVGGSLPGEHCHFENERWNSTVVTIDEVKKAFQVIRTAESELVKALLRGLCHFPNIRILGSTHQDDRRLPTVSFIHQTVPSQKIAVYCAENGILCRHGLFLCTDHLAIDLDVDALDGMVRFSLAHYNTVEEVERIVSTLEGMPGW